MKSWLSRANGWQRLWLVSTAIMFLAALLMAVFTAFTAKNVVSQTDQILITQYENPRCRSFFSVDLSGPKELTELLLWDEYGICGIAKDWRMNNPHATEPYTFQKTPLELAVKRVAIGFRVFAIWSFGVILLSAFTYFLGLAINWIRAGFGKNA